MKLKKNDWISLGVAVVVPQLAGAIGAVATASSVKTWYKGLNKPSWNPPSWLFGPVWTTLYIMMGVASWLVWRDAGSDRMEDTPLALPKDPERRNALAFYALQLGLNTLWSVLFFGLHSIKGALVEIGLLWGMIAGTAVGFYKLRPAAGLLLLPYLAWSTLRVGTQCNTVETEPLAPNDDLQAKAMEVYHRLLIAYGERPLTPRRRPMHELVSTMLSHRTTQQNEARAYERMWERYGSWEAIRDAPVGELAAVIEPANFPEPKAANIKKTLARIIEERGEPAIDFLADLPTAEGLAWLMALPGVGIKTASLVLLFCFAKSILPVDTHVHRVSQRLGLIGPKVTPEVAHGKLLALLPPEPFILYNFHVNMLRHGQRVCVWGEPRCERCPLTDLCDWYQVHRTGRATAG